jgi:S-adenosylmethionine:tRNA ribosyltransferase-isomerase
LRYFSVDNAWRNGPILWNAVRTTDGGITALTSQAGGENMDPRDIRIEDYEYTLPEESIALRPLEERDASRLLICGDGPLREDLFRRIADHLPTGSLMVFNDTRVIEARLYFITQVGGLAEVFLLEPLLNGGEMTAALSARGGADWYCLVRGVSKWREGRWLEARAETPEGSVVLRATLIQREEGRFLMRFEWSPPEKRMADVLHHIGRIPLPPYIRREAEASDAERYQTVYAAKEGSVAAPTAGLHFTDAVLDRLHESGIKRLQVTLHVGAGTFKPVKAERMSDHDMHREYMEVGLDTVRLLRDCRNPVVAVGTTSLRTLESLYWMGCRVLLNPSMGPEDMQTTQWEPYDRSTQGNIPVTESMAALAGWMESRDEDRLLAQTRLIIAPGYRFRVMDALVTNFHQPRSTLLLLVAAVLGDEWRKAYEHALSNGFRFLSYGDCCLMFAKDRTADRGKE